MVEKVQGVTPSRRVRYDEGRSFGAREGFAEGGGQQFERQLRRAMKKRSEEKEGPSEAYLLEVSRPTQSLFYDRRASLAGLRAYLHEDHAE